MRRLKALLIDDDAEQAIDFLVAVLKDCKKSDYGVIDSAVKKAAVQVASCRRIYGVCEVER